MSPGPLRPETVQRRLAEMGRLLTVLARHESATGADLEGDLERRLIVERALQQLVDLAVKVNAHVVTSAGEPAPADYHTSFAAAGRVGLMAPELAARLAPSAGLRNRLALEYDEIDLDIVAAALPSAVGDFRMYVEQAARWLQEQSRPTGG